MATDIRDNLIGLPRVRCFGLLFAFLQDALNTVQVVARPSIGRRRQGKREGNGLQQLAAS